MPTAASTRRLPPTLPERYPWQHLRRFRGDPLALAMDTAAFGRAEGAAAVHVRFGPRSAVHLLDPALIGELLTQREDACIKPPALRFSKFLLGEGLLTSEGDAHHRQRKLVLPAFHYARIAGYADTMAALAAKRHADWADGEIVAIDREMMRLTLEIVAKTLFDADVRGEATAIGQALTNTLLMFDRATQPLGWMLNKIPLPSTLRLYGARARLDAIIYRLIQERRTAAACARTHDPGDLLSVLLAAQDEATGRGMTDRQVRDEAMTLFLAGHETTAIALTWTLALLAQHPAAEERLHAEVDAFGGRRFAFEDVSDLTYTRQVVSEGLRLYPPAWSFARQALRPVPLGRYAVPEGWLPMVVPYQLHRDPALWEAPERFDPERFSAEQSRARPKFSYLPFSAGRRGCIGEQFAWTEAVLVLATLAQRWRFRLVGGALPGGNPGITLRPAAPIMMRVSERMRRGDGETRRR